MNIQIYGKNKCFDTKKAERYFKERGIKFQRIDVARFGMSAGELQSVKRAVGSLEALVDEKAEAAALIRYLSYEADREEKLLENLSRLLPVKYVPNQHKGFLPLLLPVAAYLCR